MIRWYTGFGQQLTWLPILFRFTTSFRHAIFSIFACPVVHQSQGETGWKTASRRPWGLHLWFVEMKFYELQKLLQGAPPVVIPDKCEVVQNRISAYCLYCSIPSPQNLRARFLLLKSHVPHEIQNKSFSGKCLLFFTFCFLNYFCLTSHLQIIT